MGTTANKLNNILSTKLAIKQAIIDKGVADINDVFSTYPSKIREITVYDNPTTYDWTAIGFPKEPEMIEIGYNHAVALKNEYLGQQPTELYFSGDNKLVFFPDIDTSKTTNFNAAFSNTSIVAFAPTLNFENAESVNQMFFKTPIQHFPTITLGIKLKSLQSFLYECPFLRIVEEIDTSRITDFSDTFRWCSKLEQVKGLDFSAVDRLTNCFQGCTALRYLLIKNIGMKKNMTEYDFSEVKNWGIDFDYYEIGYDEITSCKQSLIDTLLTYSYDRKTAAYQRCVITLSDRTKGLLSKDDIAQITAKGYSIA